MFLFHFVFLQKLLRVLSSYTRVTVSFSAKTYARQKCRCSLPASRYSSCSHGRFAFQYRSALGELQTNLNAMRSKYVWPIRFAEHVSKRDRNRWQSIYCRVREKQGETGKRQWTAERGTKESCFPKLSTSESPPIIKKEKIYFLLEQLVLCFNFCKSISVLNSF